MDQIDYIYKYEKYKNKYLKLKNYKNIFFQNGQAIFETKKTNKKYSGAGILLIEKYINDSGIEKPVIILFKSKRKNEIFYEDLGGSINKQDLLSFYPLAFTACREAFEESRGLIHFTNPLHIGSRIDGKDVFIDILHNEKLYRSYLVCLKPGVLDINDYNYNKKQLNRDDVPSVMKETDGFRRFYINDLINTDILNDNDGPFEAKDTSGRNVKIFERTQKIINSAYKKDLFNFILKYPKEMINIRSLISVH